MTDSQRRIWEFVGDQTKHIDDMARQLNLPVSELTGTLMLMEMKRLIRRLPGNHYERC
jgi:DNA processing protein